MEAIIKAIGKGGAQFTYKSVGVAILSYGVHLGLSETI